MFLSLPQAHVPCKCVSEAEQTPPFLSHQMPNGDKHGLVARTGVSTEPALSCTRFASLGGLLMFSALGVLFINKNPLHRLSW